MQGNRMKRIFVAVPIQLETANRFLLAAEQQLGIASDDLYAADQLHLTLRFLGNIPDAVTQQLCVELATLLCDSSAFDVYIEQWEWWEHLHTPALVGLVRLSQELSQLHALVCEAVSSLDLPVDTRNFVPHITCCRKKNLATSNGRGSIDKRYLAKPLPCTINAVVIYASDKNNIKQPYSVIRAFPLNHNTVADR
jgi:RNA 2',3'-cyclic 3'-phosphodiesterase